MLAATAPLASAVSHIASAPYWASVLLFFGIPVALLSFWERHEVLRAAKFSLALLPLGVAIDIVMHLTGQWWVETALPWRLFGLMPVEDLLWPFLYVVMLVLAYEHFWDDHQRRHRAHLAAFAVCWLTVLVVCLILLQHIPAWLDIPYAYLTVGAFIIFIPLFLEVRMHPKLLPKFIRYGLFFIPYLLFYEITALRLGWWSFPAKDFIGLITTAGVSFPVEELLVWIVFGSAGFMSWYEYVTDDQR